MAEENEQPYIPTPPPLRERTIERKPSVSIDTDEETIPLLDEGVLDEPLLDEPEAREKLEGPEKPLDGDSSIPLEELEIPSYLETEKAIEDAAHIEIDSPTDSVQESNNADPRISYEQDVANAVKKEDVTVAQMALAEQEKLRKEKRKPTKEELRKSRKITTKIVIALVSVGVVIVAAISIVIPKINKTFLDDSISPYELIRVDDRNEIELADRDSQRLLELVDKKIDNNQLPLGNIRNIFFTTADPTTESGKRVLNSQEFIRAIGLTFPSSFIRSIGDEYMFGFHAFEGNVPFIIFKIESFENAFAGMLTWEEVVETGQEVFFETVVPKDTKVIASPTDPESPLLSNPIFEDSVVRREDARILPHPNGKLRIVYSFVNPTTLIITSNEATLAELLSRLGLR